jgi:hypothetical protein
MSKIERVHAKAQRKENPKGTKSRSTALRALVFLFFAPLREPSALIFAPEVLKTLSF